MQTVLSSLTDGEGGICKLLTQVGALLWAATYLIVLVQCARQRTYGFPWPSLCLNLTWEFFLAWVCPSWQEHWESYCSQSTDNHLLVLRVWFFLDLLLFLQLLLFGRKEHSGIMERYFFGIVLGGLGLAFLVQETFVTHFTDDNAFSLAWIINLLMSVLFLKMFFERSGGRGLSLLAAWTKLLANVCMGACLGLFSPPPPPQNEEAFLVLLTTATVVADICYVILLHRRRRSGPPGGGSVVTRSALAATVLFCCATSSSFAASGGRLDGQVVDVQGEGIGGVTVTLEPAGLRQVTGPNGRYSFEGLEAGSYEVLLRLGENSLSATTDVAPEGAQFLETTVEWAISFPQTITVRAASRGPETRVAAPVAVTLVTEEAVERQAASGQVPRLLAFSAGVELSQSGLFDFNLNTRGFNGALNPRVLNLIDGRDPSIPGIGSQDWASVPFPLDDLERLELVRGPGSALYGAGAYNGVLDMTTREPRSSQGGQLRLTLGELDTRRADLRHAGRLGHDLYFKISGGYHKSEDFARPRVDSVEYRPDLLAREAIAPPLDGIKIAYGGFRLDKYFGSRGVTLETGTSEHEGWISVTEVGRTQQPEVERPWGRLRLTSPHWLAQVSYTSEKALGSFQLGSGGRLFLNGSRLSIDLQGDRLIADGRGRLLGGLSGSREELDSADRTGTQTIFSEAEKADRQSVYGQAEYDLLANVKAAVAARWDGGDLHDPRLSPRGSLVYAPSPRHTLRVSYGSGFKSPAFSEVFLRVPVTAPLDLSALEAALAPGLGGVPLGFQDIPILAIGNKEIKPEKITGLELGYNGIFGRNVWLTLDLYRNRLEDFATDLLSQAGTSLGRLNRSFGPYAPPQGLSPEAAAAVLAALANALPPELFASLSNDADGSPILVLLSSTNSGRVLTEGAELGLSWQVRDWLLELNYSYFDFRVEEQAPESPLTPNTPRNRYALAVSRTGAAWSGSLGFRWVEGFDWASGIFAGPVPSFGVADLAVSYHFRSGWEAGIDISNLLDDGHYEIFGGDLLRRRALASLSWSW